MAMLIHLHTAYGCFHTMTVLGSCDGGGVLQILSYLLSGLQQKTSADL